MRKNKPGPKAILAFLGLMVGPAAASPPGRRPVDYVDMRIATAGARPMVYIGAGMPFGFVTLSPENKGYVWRSGYDYNIGTITGFAHIHAAGFGGLLMMPTVGDLKVYPGTPEVTEQTYRSRFRHETEVTSVGYYAVTLDDYQVRAEMSATTRAGIQRYTFPETNRAHILFDLQYPHEYGMRIIRGKIRKVSDTEIEGHQDGRASGPVVYSLYFVARFSKPFKSFGGWTRPEDTWLPGHKEMIYRNVITPGFDSSALRLVRVPEAVIYRNVDRVVTETGQGLGAFVDFDTKKGEAIVVKTGISLVSLEDARLNMDAEMGRYGQNLEAVRDGARRTWNELLGRVEVEGGTETDRTKFYTFLYRSFARTIVSDVNGKYVGVDYKIHQLKDPNSPMLASDTFWNTFWNLNQLWALMAPEWGNAWVRSLLQCADDGGWLPRSPMALTYLNSMVASPQIPLIAGMYQMGIRHYDVEKAYQAVRKLMMEPGRVLPGVDASAGSKDGAQSKTPAEAVSDVAGPIVGNEDLELYKTLGFVPHNIADPEKYAGGWRQRPTNTLDYAYEDYCVAEMAKSLGKVADYRYFLKRAHNYQNQFDPGLGYMWLRWADGTWAEPTKKPFHPTDYDNWPGYPLRVGFAEGNAWQYTWFVPHDVKGLAKLLGKEEFVRRLNEGFEKSRSKLFDSDYVDGDYLKVGNEPNMQAPFLFNYAGAPWLTQKWARLVQDEFYRAEPMGFGHGADDDEGQMAAMYCLSAMGLFQMNGGTSAEPTYEIGSPAFTKITLHLDGRYYGGRAFVIEARNNSKRNVYVQSATLNGKALKKCWFYRSELVKGGKLVLQMGPEPNKTWGSAPDEAPPSMIDEDAAARASIPNRSPNAVVSNQ